jgi:hypothetical protein
MLVMVKRRSGRGIDKALLRHLFRFHDEVQKPCIVTYL